MEVQCFSFGSFVLIPARQALLRRGTPVRLGARALEILTVLVQRPGAVIDKRELMSLVWSDTFVDDSNLKVHIAALRKALDEDDSQPSCIATVIGRGYRFVETVLDCAMNGSAKHLGHMNRLPNVSKRLFGREEVVRGLASQVEKNRLVTLVGSAGIGKTAVARAVAEILTRKYEHGTCFVDLCTLADPNHVPKAVAEALGLKCEMSDAVDRFTHRLGSAEMLMVLDTCDVAIDAVAALADLIHSSCPRVHILATSREILRAGEERVFRLPPLGTPPRDVGMTAAELKRYSAVQLFLDRAAEKPDDRGLTDAEAALVAALCTELDGVPLAIELVARRVRALGLVGLSPVFTDDLFSLDHGERTAPPRHRSLGAALEWSLESLPDNERLVLLRLCDIEGCFDLDEAIAAASDSAMGKAETAACIANLVSKSLVEREGYGKVNFRLLNSVRSYASRRLAEHSEPRPRRASGERLTDRGLRELECRDDAFQMWNGKVIHVMSGGEASLLAKPREHRHSIRATAM